MVTFNHVFGILVGAGFRCYKHAEINFEKANDRKQEEVQGRKQEMLGKDLKG